LKTFRLLGFVFLGVGALGVVLPLLPATPFVLLSAACFARSSERWHRWMMANETFGPMIRNWETNRCISRRIKMIGIFSMLLVGGFSIFYVVESPALRIAGGILLLVGFVVISLIPSCENGGDSQ
jgi:uncharacterized membrane protein YbaN (DUF454 family)